MDALVLKREYLAVLQLKEYLPQEVFRVKEEKQRCKVLIVLFY